MEMIEIGGVIYKVRRLNPNNFSFQLKIMSIRPEYNNLYVNSDYNKFNLKLEPNGKQLIGSDESC